MAITPMMIDLKGKKTVVVGGGKVAERRVTSLLESEANIIIVSPSLTEKLLTLHQQKRITWLKKTFSPEDLHGAFLIISAAGSAAVNREVTEAAPPECLLNAASDASSGNVHFPAHFKRGRLSIAVSTNGASPILAKRIRERLESSYDERYEAYMDFLFEVRQVLKRADISGEEKEKYLITFLSDSYLDKEVQQQALSSLYSTLKQSAKKP